MDWIRAVSDLSQGYLFFAVFMGVALWESVWPRCANQSSARVRWLTNLALALCGMWLIRWLLPVAALSAAAYAETRHWGVLNLLGVSSLWACIAAVLAIDAASYLLHRLDHAVPLLWRFHQVHHADLDVDCSTALLAHPVAMLWEHAVGVAVIMLIGAPPMAVALTLLLRSALVVFHHGNIMLAPRWDRALRYVIVTPDMHRVHHSALYEESRRNFSVLFPWWDRLLGSHQAVPGQGHVRMATGLEEIRDPQDLSIGKLLLLPFRRLPKPIVV